MSSSNDFVTVGDIAQIHGNPASYRVISISDGTILIGSTENINDRLILKFDSRTQKWSSDDINSESIITFESKNKLTPPTDAISSRKTRKGFSRGSGQEMFLIEDLYILNQLGKMYHEEFEIHKNYKLIILDEIDAKWYEDYGARVKKDNKDTFVIYTTEEFVHNVQPLLTRPVPFDNVILMEDGIDFVDPQDQEKFPNSELIKSRPYIKIDKELNAVILSIDEKGSDLTIDDILFGSKGLMFEEYRDIYSYTIKSSNENTLVLELDIDNYRTYY